jgi:hypothetical protein
MPIIAYQRQAAGLAAADGPGYANALYEHDALSSHGLHRSTFGEEGLNFRVRNGIG